MTSTSIRFEHDDDLRAFVQRIADGDFSRDEDRSRLAAACKAIERNDYRPGAFDLALGIRNPDARRKDDLYRYIVNAVDSLGSPSGKYRLADELEAEFNAFATSDKWRRWSDAGIPTSGAPSTLDLWLFRAMVANKNKPVAARTIVRAIEARHEDCVGTARADSISDGFVDETCRP